MAALTLSILGSGSSGNGAVLVLESESRRRAILIDLGLSRRRTLAGLAALRLGPADLAAAVVTHLDRDHYLAGWGESLAAWGIPLYLHERHRGEARSRGVPPAAVRHYSGRFLPADGIEADPLLAAHDEWGSVAFRFRTAAGDLAWATDLGRVPRALPRHFAGARILAIESNYCPRRQEASPRPAFLKQRITGGRGHLSNEQAIAAVAEIAAAGGLPDHLVLLHLSEECNCPAYLRSLVAERLPAAAQRLAIAGRGGVDEPLRIAGRPAAMPGLFEHAAAELSTSGDRCGAAS
jgi:phosphoribosyl 1,2-cyclic phosphodiesterase